MDNIPIQLMQQLAMAALGSMAQPSNPGGMSDNPFAYHGMASIMPEEDNFFGPIGTLAATMVPGLSTTGLDGRPTPILKTNFRMKNSGMTGMQNMAMRQNAAAYAAARAENDAAAQAGWGKLFGEGSATSRLIDESNMSDADKESARKWAAMAGSPMAAQLATPLVNQLLGYDRGAGAAVVNAKSPFMTASFMARQGMTNAAPFDTPTGGRANTAQTSTYNQLEMYNPFGEEATANRTALSGIANGAVQKLMWDGMIKKSSVNGASEELVAQIVTDAIASGAVPDIDSAVNERKSIQSQVGAKQKERADAVERLRGANERGDKSAADLIEKEIMGIDKELEPLGKQLDDISGKIAKGMEPLVESVTGVVDSLRDFYGGETEAKEALDRLTGGQGSKDKKIADRVHEQVSELKIMGAMAGLDPQVTGAILAANQQSLGRHGSGLSRNSMAHGSQALAFTNDLMGQLIGSGLDPTKANEQIEAHRQGVEAWDQSRGKKVLTMLVHARQEGLFSGQEDEFQELMSLATSGSVADLKQVQRRLGTKMMGSESAFMDFIMNPQNMALVEGGLSKESSDMLGEAGVRARNAEMDRAGDFGYRRAEINTRVKALKQAGISTKEIDNAIGSAGFDNTMEFLRSKAGGENGAAVADLLDKEYQSALETEIKRGGDPNDPEVQRRAKERAEKSARSKGYYTMLDEKTQDDLQVSRMDASKESLRALEFFEGRSDGTISAKKGGYFESAGASDKYGVTRSSMNAATKSMVKTLKKMGGQVDQKAVNQFERQYNELMKAGKYDEARDLAEKFHSSLDESTRKFVDSNAKKESYRTKTAIDKQEQTDDKLQAILGDKEVAKIMEGMDEDTKRRYIDMQRKRITETDPKKREEYVKQLMDMEKKAKEESKSDAEKALGAWQEGDIQKVFEVFKNGNASLEDFFSLIRKISGALGGVPVSAGDAAAAVRDNGSNARDRAEYLEGTVADMDLADRLVLGENADEHLNALNGGKVDEKFAEKYKNRIKRIRQADAGSKDTYLKLLADETKTITAADKNLAGRIKDVADEVPKGESVASLAEKLGKEEKGSKKYRQIEKQLAAAKEMETLKAQKDALAVAQSKIDEEKKRAKGMTDAEFAQHVRDTMDIQERDGLSTAAGASGAGGGAQAGAGQDMQGLFQRMDKFLVMLEQILPGQGNPNN